MSAKARSASRSASAASEDFPELVDVDEEVQSGSAAIATIADVVFSQLQGDYRLGRYWTAENMKLRMMMYTFILDGFNGRPVGTLRVDTDSIQACTSELVPSLLEAIQRPMPLGEDVLLAAFRMCDSRSGSQSLGKSFFEQVRNLEVVVPEPPMSPGPLQPQQSKASAAKPKAKGKAGESPRTDSPPAPVPASAQAPLAAPPSAPDLGAAQSEAGEINTRSFEDLNMDSELVDAAKDCWQMFLNAAESREAAGEAILSAIFEGAPSLQGMFTTPRAVQAMRFLESLNSCISALDDPVRLKVVVETLGFGHLQMDVTVPRVSLFRDAILELFATEFQESFSPSAREGLTKLLNYIGGAIIFVKGHYAGRLQILAESWKIANDRKSNAIHHGEDSIDDEMKEKSDGKEKDNKEMNVQFVPTVYPEMFHFNAAVMGFGTSIWMNEVLAVFDNIVMNVANSGRLQEECGVLALRISKCTQGAVNLAEYKACMLASLRALLPKVWSPNHEVAWIWLWENVQRLVEKDLGNPKIYEKALAKFMDSLDEEEKYVMRKDIYSAFFLAAPVGQDYFKQSNTRLHYIAERIMEKTVELYREPVQMVDDISALGLRHVGYGIPIELFSPFVTASIEVVTLKCKEETTVEAFRWSLGLIAKMLVRTITEGSTIVMKAINRNSPKQLKKAITCAPRGERAYWQLVVQVGTQNISPLEWAIQSGSLDVANAIIIDLLTFRADRERYYYGVDMLFDRHPDIVFMLCQDAPTLLPTLLDGLIWRSRNTKNGIRRVNFYVRHMMITEEGKHSPALQWLAASKDSKIISHPVIVLASDTLWKGIVRRQFVFRKIWFISRLFIFLMSQSIMPKFSSNADSDLWIRIIIFTGRIMTYAFAMPRLFWSHGHRIFLSYFRKDLVWAFGILPLPKYLQDPFDAAGGLLMLLLVAMCTHEPMWYCYGSDAFPTEDCPDAEQVTFFYKLFSMTAMAFHWLLLIDLAVFSTKLSAFVLVCGHVFSELVRFLVALLFLLLTFGSAIACLRRDHPDFMDVPSAILSLFSITLYMMPRDYRELQMDPALLIAVFAFVIISVILLLNLLIAQLNCSYEYVYQDSLGFARLQRASVICETLETVAEERWKRFVSSLRLEQPVEFNEGDVGLPGAIQVNEPASANPITTETIHRFGGTCSPEMQWPEEAEEQDRFERMEKLIQKALKRVNKAVGQQKKGGRGTGTGTGTGSFHSNSGGSSAASGSSDFFED